jgi:hypothetical protein
MTAAPATTAKAPDEGATLIARRMTVVAAMIAAEIAIATIAGSLAATAHADPA